MSSLAATPTGNAHTDSLFLVNEKGDRRPAKSELEAALSPPLDFEGEYKTTHKFDEPTWLQVGDAKPLKVIGFNSRQRWGHAKTESVMGEGLAGLTAELVLRSLDGSIHRMFSNRDLQQWTFDPKGKVVPRDYT